MPTIAANKIVNTSPAAAPAAANNEKPFAGLGPNLAAPSRNEDLIEDGRRRGAEDREMYLDDILAEDYRFNKLVRVHVSSHYSGLSWPGSISAL